MKTKHILTALALPAMFAACTAEDIVSENSSIQQDRAKLSENFALVVSADGVESRYDANGGAPLFETGDKIGAALIDKFTYGEDVEDWEILPSLANNTPFTYDAGVWSVPENQPMGIGNYFFKFPYDKNDRSRAAVIYSLPTVQNQFTEKNGNVDTEIAIENGNMSIAHAVFTEEDEMGKIDLKNIFTYPKFRIQFDNGEKVNTVSKVVIINNEQEFIVKSGFKHQAVVNLFNNDEPLKWISDTKKVTNWDAVDTYDLIYNATPDVEDAEGNVLPEAGVAEVVTSHYLVAQMPEEAKVKYDSNTENKYIDVRFVMPSEEVASDLDLTMLVYTDNGMYQYDDVYTSIVWKKTTDDDVKAAVFARSKNYNLTLKALDEVESTETMVVTSKEDWNELVSVYGGVKKGAYSIDIVGKEFGFDETTKMPKVAKFTITGDAYVKGEVTFSNVVVVGNTYVEEGAVLTTSETFDPADIYNEGEVIIAQVLDEEGDVENYDKISTIFNEGVLTINEETEATFALYNEEKAVVKNNGEINIENAEVLVNGTEVEKGNKGTIENKGIINLTGDFTNEGERYNAAGKIVNMPTIENEGEIFAKDGDLKNNGTINNEEDAVMTCKNQDGEIINNNILNVVDGSVTYITSNTSVINVDKAVPAELVVKTNGGTIEYKAKGSVSFDKSIVNKIHVIDDVTISDLENVSTICVDKDAEITLLAAAEVTTLKIEKNATVALKSNLTVTSLTLAKGAELNIPAGKKLTVKTNGGTIANEGTIRVAGSFYAEGIEATADGVGTIKDNGTSAEVKFYDAETAAKQAAWNEAVSAWANGETPTVEGWYKWYSGSEKNTAGQAFYEGNPYDYEAFYAVATHDAWKTREVITALGTMLTAPAYNADGTLKSTSVPGMFTTAVDNLLKKTANEDKFEAAIYDADGKFNITWAQTDELFEKVSDMYKDMAVKFNTVATIQNVFGNDAVAAGYAWYNEESVWTKLNAKYPYAYVWKSTETLACPLYDVCAVIVKSNEAGWNKLFGTTFGVINSKADVQAWLQAAAVTEATTTLGKLAKDIADDYYTASLEWNYSNEQVCECLNGAIFVLTGTAGNVQP